MLGFTLNIQRRSVLRFKVIQKAYCHHYSCSLISFNSCTYSPKLDEENPAIIIYSPIHRHNQISHHDKPVDAVPKLAAVPALLVLSPLPSLLDRSCRYFSRLARMRKAVTRIVGCSCQQPLMSRIRNREC